MGLKTKRIIAALTAVLAAAVCISGCGYIEDWSGEDTVSEVQSEAAAEISDQSVGESVAAAEDEPQEALPEDGASEYTESEAYSDSLPDSDTEFDTDSLNDTAVNETVYTNSEFGFTLPLPDGTEYYENDDVLKPASDNADVQFRSLMDTKSTDSFNLSVQLYETQKTADDFVNDRREYIDEVNAQDTDDYMALTYTSEAEIGGKQARVMIEKLAGYYGDHFTLRVYIQIADGQYIYIQGNCNDEASADLLRVCAENVTFN